MIDLITTFVGVKIKNSLIIASSPLTENLDSSMESQEAQPLLSLT